MASDAQIERFVAVLERELDRSLETIIGDLGFTEGGIESAAQVNQVLGSLIDARLDEAAGRLEAVFAEELKELREDIESVSGKKVVFSQFDRAGIETLLNNELERHATTLKSVGFDLQAILTRQILTGEKPNILSLRDEVAPRIFNNIRTELRTSSLAFNRTVTLKKAQDTGLEYFVYRGPDDKSTRPFCNMVLRQGPVYTLPEIRRLDNEQGLPVEFYGGGYNCRHRWRPITESRAKALGYRS